MRTIKGISALLLAACSSIASAEGWQLHGFGDISVRNDYVTPRGLVVTTSGAAVQVLNGLVAVSPGGVAFHGGTWGDLNPGYSKADGTLPAVKIRRASCRERGWAVREVSVGLDALTKKRDKNT